MEYEIVVLGDSVAWGQGLLEEEKSYSSIWHALSTAHPAWKITLSVLAHSGASIDSMQDWKPGEQLPIVCSEVPLSVPTLRQQCKGYAGDANQVGLVLVNGGINDIDIRFILNPYTRADDLEEQISRQCYSSMLSLLGEVGARFPNAAANIIVLGYYPILSTDTHLPWITPFLAELGVGTFPGIQEFTVVSKVIDLSLQFWRQSDVSFERAVKEANANFGGTRFAFAKLPFAETNSVFASDPWLFGLDPFLNPEDHVVRERCKCCEQVLKDFIAVQQCYRASAGHPNAKGSERIADSILRLIGLNR